MAKTVLILATFGVEVVHAGGTLALHAQAGDAVHAAVVLCRPDVRTQVQAAAATLGLSSVEFLNFDYGEVQPDTPSKIRLVRLLRKIRPDILITQDPEYIWHDLDPDRRTGMLLYMEALAMAGREWRIEECGGYKPHVVSDIYYMWSEEPNCIVEVGGVYTRKLEALKKLTFQLAFTAQLRKTTIGEPTLRNIIPDYDKISGDDQALGWALQSQMEKAKDMAFGLLEHSGGALAEAYRHAGPIKLDRLI